MKIVYSFKKTVGLRNPVVALGVFDGVHAGHRRILKDAVRKARAVGGKSVVVTFYPHPHGEPSLYSLNHRLRLIAELGIDVCYVIKFNAAFSRISADNFLRNFLVNRLKAKFIYIGNNFKFGKFAKGDAAFLRKYSKVCGYELKVFKVIKVNGRIVSSTYIRKLITKGRLAAAERLLERPVTILGTVIKGMSIARRIGFPTANIDPHHEILPPSGVYAVRVFFENSCFRGVCNIGRKPTVLKSGKQPDKHVEVYILGFNRNIYSKDLEIQFLYRIRDEKKFSSLTALSKQIKKDVSQAS